MSDRLAQTESALHSRVAFSISTSADLPRLALTHQLLYDTAWLVAQSVLDIGSTLVYSGRIETEGFAGALLRAADGHHGRYAFEWVVPEVGYRSVTAGELEALALRLEPFGALKLLDSMGSPVSLETALSGEQVQSDEESLTALRKYVARSTGARFALGGRLAGFVGSRPGLVEECLLSLQSRSTLLIAGAFGGAARAIGHALWPDEYHGGAIGAKSTKVAAALAELQDLTPASTRLSSTERQVLATSADPQAIAAAVGLALQLTVKI